MNAQQWIKQWFTRIGGPMIPGTILLATVGILSWTIMMRKHRDGQYIRGLIQKTVAVFTYAMWTTNLVWYICIYIYDIFKPEFEKVNRRWNVAIALYTLNTCIPLLVLPTYWIKRSKPAAAGIIVNLIPRLITAVSALNSLEAFRNHPSAGWLTHYKALFARDLYTSFVIISIASSLSFPIVNHPHPERSGESVRREPVGVESSLGPGQLELRPVKLDGALRSLESGREEQESRPRRPAEDVNEREMRLRGSGGIPPSASSGLEGHTSAPKKMVERVDTGQEGLSEGTTEFGSELGNERGPGCRTTDGSERLSPSLQGELARQNMDTYLARPGMKSEGGVARDTVRAGHDETAIDGLCVFLIDPAITDLFGRATFAAVVQLLTFP